jgi:hypothetical protein
MKEQIIKQDIKMTNKQFTITKRIAKHGSQAIIVIPKILESQLEPGTLAQIKIVILKEEVKGGMK